MALVVGVSVYEGSGLRNLDYAEKDAADLAEELTKLGYRVTLLTRVNFKALDKDVLLPTADNFRDQLTRGVLKGRGQADTVLVAFSGHGAHLKQTDKLYYCPVNTKLDKPESLVSVDEVMAALRACGAGSKALLMDACRNNPTDDKSAGGAPELRSVTRPLLPAPPGGTLALFGCSRGGRSFESHSRKNGYLMHYVLEGLRGKAADPRTGLILWDNLVAHMKREVPDAVKAEKGPRYGQLPESLGQANRIVLAQLTAHVRPAALRAPSSTVARSWRESGN